MEQRYVKLDKVHVFAWLDNVICPRIYAAIDAIALIPGELHMTRQRMLGASAEMTAEIEHINQHLGDIDRIITAMERK